MDRGYSIEELSGLTGFSSRTIHHLVYRGIIEKPLGGGRGSIYSENTLTTLLDIKGLMDEGLSLYEARRKVRSRQPIESTTYTLVPGFELVLKSNLDPGVRKRVEDLSRDFRGHSLSELRAYLESKGEDIGED